jgi:O-antigen ligase
MTENQYLSQKNWIYLIVMTVLSIGTQFVPYRSNFSALFQLAIVGATVLWYSGRPVVAFSAILLLHVVPSTVFFATNSEFQNYYQLNDNMIAILCIVLLIFNLHKRKWKVHRNSASLWSMLFGVLLILSRVYTGSAEHYGNSFMAMAIMYISLSWFIEDMEDVRFVWLSFMFAGAVFVVTMLREYSTQGSIYAIGAAINRNYLALFDVIVFFMAFSALFIQKLFPSKPYKIFAIALSVGAAFLTTTFASRSAFLILVAYAAIVLALEFRQSIKSVLLIAVVTAVVVWWVLESNSASFLYDRFFMERTLTGANGRTELWTGYIREFLSCNIFLKLFGHGYKVFTASFNSFDLYAHNSYLGILIDFGLVGFALYVGFLFKTVNRLRKNAFGVLAIAFFMSMLHMISIELHQDFGGICFLTACIGIGNVSNALAEEKLA